MLDIDRSLMLFVLVVFLLLIYLLNKIAYKPLVEFMDRRDSSIAKDLEASKNLSSNSDELYTQSNEVIGEAKNEAAAIRQKAIDEAKKIAQSKLEAKQNELESSYDKFLEELGKEQKELKNSILSQLPLFKELLKAKFSKL
ncbi:MAG: F0F1 ATP synthase subunit B' [Campylobacterales bacterium]|nr:F0F1 ATP synthase subunit B' [Campylobacterales bacterium]